MASIMTWPKWFIVRDVIVEGEPAPTPEAAVASYIAALPAGAERPRFIPDLDGRVVMIAGTSVAAVRAGSSEWPQRNDGALGPRDAWWTCDWRFDPRSPVP